MAANKIAHLARPVLLSVALLGAQLGVAFAAPVNYAESVSGDLPSIPSSAFAFDVGANAISGETHFTVNFGNTHFDVDRDSFAFIIPVGASLTGITLSFVTTPTNASKASADFGLCLDIEQCFSDPSKVLGQQTANFLAASPEVFDFGGVLALGAGTYSLTELGLSIAPIVSADPVEGWFADYTWTFNVVAIPEPGVLELVALGLVATVLTRRRKRQH